jgi:hypothetical protein
VLRGATHVIVVESTPTIRGGRSNFAENVGAAFSYLHKQTQLVDLRSKKQVVVFTLAPEPPHVCVLDFADNLIDRSIDAGYREARGMMGEEGAESFGLDTFRKEFGSPSSRRSGIAAGARGAPPWYLGGIKSCVPGDPAAFTGIVEDDSTGASRAASGGRSRSSA